MIIANPRDTKCVVDTLQSIIKDIKSGTIRMHEFNLDTPVAETTSSKSMFREYVHTGEVYLMMKFQKVPK